MAVLDESEMAPGIKFDKCMELLENYQISYSLNSLHTSLFLVLMANRGGLGLSQFNVYSTLSFIIRSVETK